MYRLVISLTLLLVALKFLKDLVLVVVSFFLFDVPYVPTPKRVVKKLVKRVKMKKGQRLVDLGSGDGRVSSAFAKRYPIEALGVEKAWWMILIAKIKWRMILFKKGKLKIAKADFFEVDLKKADVVYMYLLRAMNQKLKPKLERELRKGARVVTWVYPLDGKKFELVDEFGFGKSMMRVYEKV